jgi:uncharacterized membrane protein YbhN (UPF0104 family)
VNQSLRRLTTRPTWGAVLGVVPDRGLRRRPSEVARIAVGALVVAVGAVRARNLSRVEVLVHDAVNALPSALVDTLKVLNGAGVLLSALAVVVASIAARRIRFIGSVAVAAGATALIGVGLQHWVDAPAAVAAGAQAVTGTFPEYPTLRLAVLAAIFFVAAPELTRPARRLQWILLVLVAFSVVAVTDGYPSGLLGSLALGWAVAALVHLAFGSPDGMPEPSEVVDDTRELGVDLRDLTPATAQVWGEQTFTGADADGDVRVVVIGRDATDAHLLSKLFRFVWYKDSGPTLAVSRTQHVEHRAYVLLLAERADVATARVVAAGPAGRKRDAVLVLRATPGPTLDTVGDDRLGDEVLGAAWAQLAALHELGVSHQSIGPDALTLAPEGDVAFVDLATADAAASPDDLLADRASLLVTLAVLTSEDRAVASAKAALGTEGLAAVLPLLQAPALPRALRRSAPDVRHLTDRLRSAVVETTGVEAPQLVELRRVSVTGILMGVGTLLGVYLLIGQLTEVDFATIFADASWIWIPVVLLFSQLPQFGSAMAMLGSVSQPMPLWPVVGVQYANNFTGFVGGTVATTAMVVRFFQRQGMTPAVAVSSGLLTSTAALVLQVLFVGVGLLLVGSTFDLGDTGSGSGGGQLFLLLVLGVALISGIVVIIPRLRRRVGKLVVPQLHSAYDNLKSILAEPKKGLQLFGGNLIAQIFFAMTLWAALECYGESLGLVQLIVINSLASFIGGVAPIPGGMGVMEAGLIAGFTAAGIPQEQAVAATFTARLFTSYLPPVWGWFALNWLRRRQYI